MTVYVLMYHFVGDDRDGPFGGLKGLSTDEFRSQLSWLQAHMAHVDADRLVAHATGEKPVREDAFHLTFDDGTRDHIREVVPILEDAGLDGTFFPVTEPLVENTVPTVEKQRYLQYAAFEGYRSFLEEFAAVAGECVEPPARRSIEPTRTNLDAAENYLAEFEFYTPEERFFRYVRDELLSREQFRIAIEELFGKAWPRSEAQFVEEFYMDERDLQFVEDRGMTVGAHSHTHPNFGTLDADELRFEVEQSLASTEGILGHHVRAFAYPFGVSTPSAVDALEEHEVACAFETGNRPCETEVDRYRVPRVDGASFELVKREVTS